MHAGSRPRLPALGMLGAPAADVARGAAGWQNHSDVKPESSWHARADFIEVF